MSARDLPQNRSLAEGQEARSAPDRSARTPGELLDNLRLRLSLLPENHPSAVRDPDPDSDRDQAPGRQPDADREPSPAGSIQEPGDRRQPPEPAASDQDRSDGLAADGTDPPQDDPDEGAADEPADRADDPAAADGGSLADLIKAVKEAGDALSPSGADMSTLGEFGLFAGSGGADPYRPWFMDGEPGTPWFAEDL
jgi:hypothetical protein